MPVPVPTSSRIPTAAQQLDAPVALAPAQCRSLLDDLATITDPRQRRGRQHPLGTVLAVAVAAVLAGARSLAAIGEWAADAPGPVLAALGARRDPLTGAWQHPTGHGQPAQPRHRHPAAARSPQHRRRAAPQRPRDATRLLPLLGITSP
jgi:hypothetical protein